MDIRLPCYSFGPGLLPAFLSPPKMYLLDPAVSSIRFLQCALHINMPGWIMIYDNGPVPGGRVPMAALQWRI